MTDKQVIIDGVDVSGCKFYINNDWCCCALVYENHCKDYSNCIYKLKRQLEREEKECDEYIKDIEYLKTIIKDFTQEVIKLKQTITEIKKILQANKEELNECLYNDIDGQILQKISEVLDG